MTEDEDVDADRKASADLFDQIARTHMGITGHEFLVRWDRGDYGGVNWDEESGLTEVAMALPFARELVGRPLE